MGADGGEGVAAPVALDELLDEAEGVQEEGEDGGDGGASHVGGGSRVGGASHFSARSGASLGGNSARWPGTVLAVNPRGGGSVLGGPGSRMAGATAAMHAGSVLLTGAARALPALGSIVAPSGMNKSAQRQAAKVLATVIGGATRAPTTMSRKSNGMRSGAGGGGVDDDGDGEGRRGGAPAALLRSDNADAPLDLLDPIALRSAGGGGLRSERDLAALDSYRHRLASSGTSLGGFKVAPDGRLVIGEPAAPQPVAAVNPLSGRGGEEGEEEEEEEEGGGAEGGGGTGGARGRSVVASGGRKFRTGPGLGARLLAPAAQGWGMKKSAAGASKRATPSAVRGGDGHHSGAQFAAASGRKGDVVRAGARLEPYAYVPLDPRAAMRHAAAARQSGGGSGITGAGGGSGAAARFHEVAASTSKSVRSAIKRRSGIVDRSEGGARAGEKRRRD